MSSILMLRGSHVTNQRELLKDIRDVARDPPESRCTLGSARSGHLIRGAPQGVYDIAAELGVLPADPLALVAGAAPTQRSPCRPWAALRHR